MHHCSSSFSSSQLIQSAPGASKRTPCGTHHSHFCKMQLALVRMFFTATVCSLQRVTFKLRKTARGLHTHPSLRSLYYCIYFCKIDSICTKNSSKRVVLSKSHIFARTCSCSTSTVYSFLVALCNQQTPKHCSSVKYVYAHASIFVTVCLLWSINIQSKEHPT